MENNYEFNKMIIKIAHVIISMTIKTEDFDFDNILTGEK